LKVGEHGYFASEIFLTATKLKVHLCGHLYLCGRAPSPSWAPLPTWRLFASVYVWPFYTHIRSFTTMPFHPRNPPARSGGFGGGLRRPDLLCFSCCSAWPNLKAWGKNMAWTTQLLSLKTLKTRKDQMNQSQEQHACIWLYCKCNKINRSAMNW